MGKEQNPGAEAHRVRENDQAKQRVKGEHTNIDNQKQHPRRGGKSSRQKGNRAERAVVKFLQDHGFAAERVPLSGAAGGSYLGDISVPILGVDRVVEVKCRANGFRELYAWLTDRDILIVKADRCEPLVVVPIKLAVEIAAMAGGR
jgi:hypothetical protein